MRYDNRTLRTLSLDKYPNLLKKRKRNFVRIFETNKYNEVAEEDRVSLVSDVVIWQQGMKFYKLAYQYYGNIDYWYIIAIFNKKPTDAHVQLGEEIFIPAPLERVKELYGI